MSASDSDNNGRDLSVMWQGYSRDGELDLTENLEQVALAFRVKFGYPALETKWAGAVILAGPIGVRPKGLTERAIDASRTAVELSPEQAAQRALQLAMELEM